MPDFTLPDEFTNQRQYDRRRPRPKRKWTALRSCAARTSSRSRRPRRCRRSHRLQTARSRSATTSPPTTSCRPAQRFCPYRSNIPYHIQILLRRLRRNVPRSAPRVARQQHYCRRRKLRPGLVPRTRRTGCRCTWALRLSSPKVFARIHCANLINAGILPLDLCKREPITTSIDQGDELDLPNMRAIAATNGDRLIVMKTRPQATEIPAAAVNFSDSGRAKLLLCRRPARTIQESNPEITTERRRPLWQKFR